MSDKADRIQILSRGHDLTVSVLDVIADDMRVVMLWCMRNQLKKTAAREQLRKAIEARLGRRPLVIAAPVASHGGTDANPS